MNMEILLEPTSNKLLIEYWDKEEEIKKADKEAILNSISKTEVIKVIREEAKKLGIHQKEAITTKASELFKKAQDAKHEVLKRQHTEKVRKSLELKKHKYDSYIWTVSRILKPEPITDIKNHPKTKPVIITVYKGTDGKNFDVYKPFLFGAFGICKLDELREIIPKKKNEVDKLTSRDKSLDLSAFKLSRLLFIFLSSGSLVVGDRIGFSESIVTTH
nr:hypothetical protein [Tanacetum cinerariifolium]